MDDAMKKKLDELAAAAAEKIFGAQEAGRFERNDFIRRAMEAFGEGAGFFAAGGVVMDKTACPPRGESVFRSWGPAGYERAQGFRGWDPGMGDESVIFEAPPCQPFADRGEAVWPTSEALRAGLKAGFARARPSAFTEDELREAADFGFSKPQDSAGSYRRDNGKGWYTPEGDYVLHGNRARSAKTGREYRRPESADFKWGRREPEPDVTSFREPPKVFFLSKGYLAVSDRPGVAVAAAQLRAALEAGAPGTITSAKLQRLKLRVARELRSDIAEMQGACTT